MATRGISQIHQFTESISRVINSSVDKTRALGYWLLAIGQTSFRWHRFMMYFHRRQIDRHSPLHHVPLLMRSRGRLRSTLKLRHVRSNIQLREQWKLLP